MPKKYIFKILTAGEGGVGKTTLLHRYVDGSFISDTHMTIGVEFFIKDIVLEERDITLQLWDFGGQERFRFLLDSYAFGAKGAFYVFDLTRFMSLNRIEHWINICKSDNPTIPIVIIGTKLDLEQNISVEDSHIMQLKEKYGFIEYYKLSSKTGENVNKAFETLTKEILRLYHSN
ncbi:MAG: GTP-binding protein [Candidatus Lokiarchaeota archaeon]|nr:GTP-binding protein [Candidatus Lokiarchaeota archaeon]